MAKLNERQVKAILQSAKASSLGSMRASKLSEQRTDAINYYLGDMSKDMAKQEGRSGVVSTDVSDTIDGLMPSLMDIFASSEDVVRFDAVGPEDMDAAEQESDYVGHVFMQKNPGFQILQTMIKDALLSKTGIVKCWWEVKDKEERETYFNQDPEAFTILLTNPELEMVEHSENDDGTHDVTFVKRKNYGMARVENVPPEEFGVSRSTKRVQDTDYCFHEPSGGRPAADLIAEGYDKNQIDSLPTYSVTGHSGTEAKARDTVDESSSSPEDDYGVNKAMRPILVTEHYIRMDYQGDGKAGLYKVTTAGDDSTVLRKNGKADIVAFDYVPFAVAHCDPMPHRFFGRSMADKTMETQRIKTALTRGMLDNIYLQNNQQIEVSEAHANDFTLDDLMNRKTGGIVRTKQVGGLAPVVVQAIADKMLPYLQYFDMEREWRTGVTREGQGLEADALQNQTATAAKQIHNAAQAKMKLVARNIADGIEDLFWLLHAVIRKNGSQPETVRLKNKWVKVDPRQWKSRDDMTINVGLGYGGKAEQAAQAMQIMNLQTLGLQGGMPGVGPKEVHNAFTDLCKAFEKRDPSRYWQDPGEEQIQAQPDPKLIEIQLKAEIEKLQAQADIETQDRKTQAEIALAERKFELDRELKMLEYNLKIAESEHDMMVDEHKTSAKIEGDREAGKVKNEIAREGMAMKADATGGKGKSKPAAQPVQGVLTQLIKELQRMNGPKRIIRDPKSGKAVGVEPMEPTLH